MYFLPSPSARTAMCLTISDHVRKNSFGPAEIGDAEPKKYRGKAYASCKRRKVDFAMATEQAPAETVHHTNQGIETVPEAPLFGYGPARKTNWRNIEQQLNNEWNDMAKVAILHIKGSDQ